LITGRTYFSTTVAAGRWAGRHVTFWRQSLTKRPASSRLAQTQKPLRSKYNTFICVARRLMNTNKRPLSGSSPIACLTKADNPSKDLRISVGAANKCTRITPSGKTSAAHQRQHQTIAQIQT